MILYSLMQSAYHIYANYIFYFCTWCLTYQYVGWDNPLHHPLPIYQPIFFFCTLIPPIYESFCHFVAPKIMEAFCILMATLYTSLKQKSFYIIIILLTSTHYKTIYIDIYRNYHVFRNLYKITNSVFCVQFYHNSPSWGSFEDFW